MDDIAFRELANPLVIRASLAGERIFVIDQERQFVHGNAGSRQLDIGGCGGVRYSEQDAQGNDAQKNGQMLGRHEESVVQWKPDCRA